MIFVRLFHYLVAFTTVSLEWSSQGILLKRKLSSTSGAYLVSLQHRWWWWMCFDCLQRHPQLFWSCKAVVLHNGGFASHWKWWIMFKISQKWKSTKLVNLRSSGTRPHLHESVDNSVRILFLDFFELKQALFVEILLNVKSELIAVQTISIKNFLKFKSLQTYQRIFLIILT